MDERVDERVAVEEFRERLLHLDEESNAIHQELRTKDLLALAHRTQELVRLTRGLLEGNMAILFGNQPPRVSQNLKQHVDYADGHVRKALGDDYDFEVIQQRLYMATALAQYVVQEVARAVDEFEGRLNEGT
jgi:hypothetical protein